VKRNKKESEIKEEKKKRRGIIEKKLPSHSDVDKLYSSKKRK